MNEQEVIKKTADYVKKSLLGESSGHDWWHVYRVWSLAKEIGKKEKGNMFVIELAALLHDIADWKFNNGSEEVGATLAEKWLRGLHVDEEVVNHVKEIILNISFKGANAENKIKTIEGKCVQDADRLDGIGAIGIGRTFAYGGHMRREMHNPEIKPVMANNFEEYKKNGLTTINHFYEKLLLIKDRMNTKTGEKIAKEKHKFMKQFLKQFYKEWEGNFNIKN